MIRRLWNNQIEYDVIVLNLEKFIHNISPESDRRVFPDAKGSRRGKGKTPAVSCLLPLQLYNSPSSPLLIILFLQHIYLYPKELPIS